MMFNKKLEYKVWAAVAPCCIVLHTSSLKAQEQPFSPHTTPSAAPIVVEPQQFPDVPFDHWSHASFKILADVGLIEPLPFQRNIRFTRYEYAVGIARLMERISKSERFVLPPLAQTNAWFYSKNAEGDWVPRITRAEVKAALLTLSREFAPEMARLGVTPEALAKWQQGLNKYFEAPSSIASSGVEIFVSQSEATPNPASLGEKVSVNMAAEISTPRGCQLATLPTWSWQVISVKWRATDNDHWSLDTPKYTSSIYSTQGAPTAKHEYVFQSGGQWQIKVRATAEYATTNCGSGSVVAEAYIGH